MKKREPTLSSQISSRILVTILISWGLVTALVIFGLFAYYRVNQNYSRALVETDTLLKDAMDLNGAILSEVLNTRAYLINGEEAAITRRQMAHQDATRSLDRLERELNSHASTAPASLAEIVELHQAYDTVANRLFELQKAGRSQEALQLFDAQSDPLVLQVQTSSRALQDEIQERLLANSSAYSHNTEKNILIIATLFLSYLAINGIALARLASPPLRLLEYFENLLSSAAATGVFRPIDASLLPGSFRAGGSEPRLFSGYNRLVEKLQDGCGTLLKYISAMHHEGNSLLASILGYGYMLADPALRPEDASMDAYGKIIVQQTRRATCLIEDFTLAAKMEGNQYAPVLLPLQLEPLVTSLVGEMREDCERDGTPRQIRLESGGEALTIQADALSLEKAIRKVIENALKFSPADSLVTIRLGTGGSPRCVEIQVEDCGPGIPAGELDQIFLPFPAIRYAARRRGAGNHMGLFIASAILRVHGGTISVQSQVGKGSLFTMTLPLEEA